MKTFNRILLMICALLLAASPAMAEIISFSGQVTAAYAYDVYSPFTAAVDQLHVAAGDTVQAGTVIAELRTTKVYAEAAGTVTAVFGQNGDSAETIAARYGAVAYLDDGVHYTIAVSAEDAKAYNSVESQYVQPGEAVYLRSRSEESRTGTGVITVVDGTGYTVEVLTGGFLTGETVNIYRTADHTDAQRIGRGSIVNKPALAVAGTGCIVNMAVKPGDTVQRGDLLMETLTGDAKASGAQAALLAEAEGTVASISVQQGATVEAGALVATLWPWEAMQLQASIPEADLGAISAGDTVEIVFDWNQDSGESTQGTVRAISAVNDANSETTQFIAYIDFTPDASVRYGMNATVTTIE